ncbi:phosphonopyruvate decarboxylase [Porphyromonas macacae]|uniref:Acetolactate synthase n=1 Tax=Porphyromonas macacae TaxID=28115 RepID=A0A379DGS0_9PORP|nr:phosphonopyruvate decarboxylase [Porphyromonas macacae]SUB77223.1 Acetolactate synthase [Porphyromonas macacae]
MINPIDFTKELQKYGTNFFTGVPDSLLKNFCSCIMYSNLGVENIITANEGGAMGLAAGKYMASGNIPVVYLQNSGLGNIINPLLSLHDPEVYSIPTLIMIGWRGEPNVKDEPQHIKQGKVTLDMLDAMNIKYCILSEVWGEAVKQIDEAYESMKKDSSPYAIVIRKNTFTEFPKIEEKETTTIAREEAIIKIAEALSSSDIVLSTTGMISRELYETREKMPNFEGADFLNVGSMGHVSQIALGIALEKPKRRIICLDGDGATLMHLGGLAIIGDLHPHNYFHIILNNSAHDSVGGQPTVAGNIDFKSLAISLGYEYVQSIKTLDELFQTLKKLSQIKGPALIEIKVKKGSRKDLGRPKTSPINNKGQFINFLNKE